MFRDLGFRDSGLQKEFYKGLGFRIRVRRAGRRVRVKVLGTLNSKPETLYGS